MPPWQVLLYSRQPAFHHTKTATKDKIYMGLIVRSSAIHAAGCYTTTPIRKGTRIIEYDGPRFTKDEADQRYEGRDITYLFGVGEGDVVIDGFGMGMFINHCCDPNCSTEEIDERVFISAIRNIEAGEELTYEYNLYDSDDYDCPCHCDSNNCRGTMFSDEEVERKTQLLKKAAASARKKSKKGSAK